MNETHWLISPFKLHTAQCGLARYGDHAGHIPLTPGGVDLPGPSKHAQADPAQVQRFRGTGAGESLVPQLHEQAQHPMIDSVSGPLLIILLEAGYLAMIAPVAVSERGEALNVDVDRAAAMVASALRAETLLLLTAAPGLMKNFPDESTLIRQLSMAGEAAQGHMKKKPGAEEALQGGVNRVIIADGRIQNPISNAFAGNGTVIVCTAL